jgi:hypothetical protein
MMRESLPQGLSAPWMSAAGPKAATLSTNLSGVNDVATVPSLNMRVRLVKKIKV